MDILDSLKNLINLLPSFIKDSKCIEIIKFISEIQLVHTGLLIGDDIIEFGIGTGNEPNIVKCLIEGQEATPERNNNNHHWNYDKFGSFLNGYTDVSPDDLYQKCLEDDRWKRYHLFNNNCQHFVTYCLIELGVEEKKAQLNFVLNGINSFYRLRDLINSNSEFLRKLLNL